MKYPLHLLSQNEKKVLYQILNLKDEDDNKLDYKLSKLLLPAGGLFQNGIDYSEFLKKIANKRIIDISKLKSIIEIEEVLLKQIFAQKFELMSKVEKDNLINELTEAAKKDGLSSNEIASISSLATIGIAQASGFGVYVLASSAVGAITSAVGITAPFAFYTAMSSVIKIAIGPIGLLLAVIPLYHTFKDVKNSNEAFDKLSNIFKGVKSYFTGDYAVAEGIFIYFAGIRIVKLEEQTKLKRDNFSKIINVNKNISEKRLKVDDANETIKKFDTKISDVQNKIEDLKNRIANLLNNIKELKSDQQVEETKKEQIEEEIKLLTKKIEFLNKEIKNIEIKEKELKS